MVTIAEVHAEIAAEPESFTDEKIQADLEPYRALIEQVGETMEKALHVAKAAEWLAGRMHQGGAFTFMIEAAVAEGGQRAGAGGQDPYEAVVEVYNEWEPRQGEIREKISRLRGPDFLKSLPIGRPMKKGE